MGTLSFPGTTPTGVLDLNDNKMIVTSSPSLDDLGDMIARARNGGAWTGAGLTSTSAKNRSAHNTTLGVLLGSQYTPSTFAGLTFSSTDKLVKYTYYGDANFDGKIDGADYGRIDSAFNAETTAGNIGGWWNGDSNYDDRVDGADYGLIDGAFNSQLEIL